MFSWLNWKSYSAIAAGTALVIYVLGWAAGPDILRLIRSVERSAIMGGLSPNIVNLVTGPLEYGIQNYLIGAIVGGLVWPLLLLWFILMVLLLVIGFIGGGYNRVDESIIPD